MTLVDLRSDTVTRPDAAMRRAMAEAEVGDDVYGEDPSINALEEHVAQMFGHPAAMFVPTGTMGNQTAIRLLCPAGDELICDADAHIVSYEGGGAAQHGGLQTRTLVAERGLLTPDQLEPQLRFDGYHPVPTPAALRRLPPRAPPRGRRRTNAQPRRRCRLPARDAEGDPRAHVVVQHLSAL